MEKFKNLTFVMNNLLGGCPLAWCYKFLHRCSVANVVKFLLGMRVLQAPANEQLVLSFLDRMGGENEISRDRKVRIEEGTVLVWLDWWDANNADEDVEWCYLKLDGLKYEVLLAINNLTGKRYLLDGDIINSFVMPRTISLFSCL